MIPNVRKQVFQAIFSEWYHKGKKNKQEKKLQINFVVTTDSEEKKSFFSIPGACEDPFQNVSCSIDVTQEKRRDCLHINGSLFLVGRSTLTLSGH